MKSLDIKLYKMRIIKGKENMAKEWLKFLNDNKNKGIETLKNEKVYLESYFSSIEESTMYIYLFIAADNIEFANNTAGQSTNGLDLKHFEYMRSCVDVPSSAIIDCLCYMDNLCAFNF